MSSLDAIKIRLHNWGRWTRDHATPNLGVKAPPVFAYWIPAHAWDAGWGEQGAPDGLPTPIDDRDAEALDAQIQALPTRLRVIIVRHYAHDWRQQPLDLGEAYRALVDNAVVNKRAMAL